MKRSTLRTGAFTLACALALSGCGGSSGQLLLGGVISGVTKESVVLQNNGAHDTTITGSGQFYFNDLIGIDEQYNVTVKSYPSNVSGCKVYNGSGRSAFNVTSISVVCELKQHTITATVTGLAGAQGLVLVNDTTQIPISADGTNIKLGSIGEDQPYGYTVLTQPAGRICSVANGSGIMGTGDIGNVQITCVSTGT
jgi:hypothetical protein